MNTHLRQNLDLLDQGIRVLQSIDDETYRGESRPNETSYRVGPHVRHCVDAYRCLIDGLGQGEVDYDRRQRDRIVESDRGVGLDRLEEVKRLLSRLDQEDPHRELRVKVDTHHEAPGAWSRSTLRRELQFLTGHTVHHFALIALIVRSAGFDPGPEFGVAPSTLEHWNDAPAAVR